MSNNLQKEIIEYVSSIDFLKKMSEDQFKENTHNALIMVHMMCLAYNTTGIRDLGFTFSYQSILGDDIMKPRMGFYLYTTKNSLIEETSRCSNSSGRFRNKMFSSNTTRGFREKFIEYFQSIAKNIPLDYNSEQDSVRLHQMTARFRAVGSKKEERCISDFYNYIIGYHPFVKSYIEKMYFDKILNSKNNIKIVKSKI